MCVEISTMNLSSTRTSSTSHKRGIKRLIKAKVLLNKMEHTGEPKVIWFFSDEKNICQDQLRNSNDVFRLTKAKFHNLRSFVGVSPVSVITLPLHIFQQGSRLNSGGYVEF